MIAPVRHKKNTMTWHEMGIEMLRIFNVSDAQRDAHLSLIKSPFALSVRNVWLQVYKEGVKTGRVSHIEVLPIDEKKELWKSTKEMCKGIELTEGQLMDVARVLYTLETYLNL